jgi:hypothetical protein
VQWNQCFEANRAMREVQTAARLEKSIRSGEAMNVIAVNSWEQFHSRVRELNDRRDELQRQHKREFTGPLFRGMADARWELATTLERAYPHELLEPISGLHLYYLMALRSRSAIETVTESFWDAVPGLPDFESKLDDFVTLGPQMFFAGNVPIYQYLLYLRHHGYPSPLLDWTSSPYVAAFFAFDQVVEGADQACIYAFVRDSFKSHGSGEADVAVLGPYVKAHRRHMIQQSQYTVCMDWFTNRPTFRAHSEGLGSPAFGVKTELVKYTFPTSERFTVLQNLDLMNINAFSLFGSDDSLVRTMARRALVLNRFRGGGAH